MHQSAARGPCLQAAPGWPASERVRSSATPARTGRPAPSRPRRHHRRTSRATPCVAGRPGADHRRFHPAVRPRTGPALRKAGSAPIRHPGTAALCAACWQTGQVGAHTLAARAIEVLAGQPVASALHWQRVRVHTDGFSSLAAHLRRGLGQPIAHALQFCSPYDAPAVCTQSRERMAWPRRGYPPAIMQACLASSPAGMAGGNPHRTPEQGTAHRAVTGPRLLPAPPTGAHAPAG